MKEQAEMLKKIKENLPNYGVVPLRSDEIIVTAIQLPIRPVDPKNPKKGIKENLEYLLQSIDLVHTRPPVRRDLIAFPEFALQGMNIEWTREDWLRIAIEVPGEELERVGEKAKEYGSYIVLHCHTKDKDWPGHYFSTSLIVGPAGKVIHKHWKAHFTTAPTEYPTTVHDVLDEFVKRYGWDAVWPVAKTDIGNIATFVCSEGFQPETARAYAFKGAEILVRCISSSRYIHTVGWPGVGDSRITMRAYCIENDVYGVYADSAVGGQGEGMSIGAGHSMIIDNYGRILKEAEVSTGTAIDEQIPIALFRKHHSIPRLRKELYDRVYAEYIGNFPPNLYSEYLPKNYGDAVRWWHKKARW